MSSRTRGPRNRASKLPVADKPQFGQKKKKPQGKTLDQTMVAKVRKSKYSPAGPSHGTKVEEPKIATSPPHQGAVTSSCFFSADGDPSAAGSKAMEQKIAIARLLQKWSKGACYFYNPRELRGAPGAKVEEPKIHPCPHQGSDNIFDFVFCKPDCPRSVSDSVFPGRSLALRNIKDDSSSSDPVLSGRSLALVNIKDDSSPSDSVLSDRSLSLSNSEDDSSSSDSDGGMIPRPYARRPRWDPTQCTQREAGDPPFVVW